MKCPFCGVATLNLEQHIPYYHPELMESYSESRLTKLEKEVAELREILEYHIELAPGHDIAAQEGR